MEIFGVRVVNLSIIPSIKDFEQSISLLCKAILSSIKDSIWPILACSNSTGNENGISLIISILTESTEFFALILLTLS